MKSFLRAVAIARKQQAALFELRATVGLARLLRDEGHLAVARRRLERICSRFDPRFELVELREAHALLEQSGGQAPLSGSMGFAARQAEPG